MALAQIAELRRRRLPEHSARLGQSLLAALHGIHASHLTLHARGLGLLAGLELCRPDGSPATRETMRVLKAMLRRGFILLPEGEHGNVISFTPSLTITRSQLTACVHTLAEVVAAHEHE